MFVINYRHHRITVSYSFGICKAVSSITEISLYPTRFIFRKVQNQSFHITYPNYQRGLMNQKPSMPLFHCATLTIAITLKQISYRCSLWWDLSSALIYLLQNLNFLLFLPMIYFFLPDLTEISAILSGENERRAPIRVAYPACHKQQNSSFWTNLTLLSLSCFKASTHHYLHQTENPKCVRSKALLQTGKSQFI